MKNKKTKPTINLYYDDYQIELKDGRLVVKSPVPVEVHAPEVSNGVDKMIPEADYAASQSLRPGQKLQKGKYYPYQGIYLGEYSLTSPQDRNLRRVFHAFTAPEVLKYSSVSHKNASEKTLFTAVEASEFIAQLRKRQEETVFDNSGKHYLNGAVVDYIPVPRIEGRMVMPLRDGQMQSGEYVGLWNKVEQGVYKGEWFIPTDDMIEKLFVKNIRLKKLKKLFKNRSEPADNNQKIILSSSFSASANRASAYNFDTRKREIINPSSDLSSVHLVRLAPVY